MFGSVGRARKRTTSRKKSCESCQRQRKKLLNLRRESPVSFSGFRVQVKRHGGGLAQLGERLLCKQEVIGSIPIISTTRVASSAG